VVPVPVPEPVDVPVDVDAVVVVVFFEPPPCAFDPLVFVVLVAPPPVVLVLDGPCADAPPPFGADAPPPFGADVPPLGAFAVGALPVPAPRPCAAAVVPNAAIAIADAANSENLRMVWTPSGRRGSPRMVPVRDKRRSGVNIRSWPCRFPASWRALRSKAALVFQNCTSRKPSVSSIETPQGSTIAAVPMLFIAGSLR